MPPEIRGFMDHLKRATEGDSQPDDLDQLAIGVGYAFGAVLPPLMVRCGVPLIGRYFVS